jgi:hypothetical protein
MGLSPLTIIPRIAERSRVIDDTRCQDELGHYQILLPERFRLVDRECRAPSNQHSPVSVSFIRTIDEPRTELEVIGLFLRREVAPADVLRALLHEHTILEERRVPSPGGELLDVLTRKGGAEPYLSRWWTVKDGGAQGGRLYVLEGRVAEAAYPAVADELSTMLASFRLLHPTPWDYFEQLTSLAQKTPNDILCFYPESWQLTVVSDGSAGPYIAHLWQVLGQQLLGRMTILSMSGAEAPEKAIEAYAGSQGAPIEWGPVQPSTPFGGLETAWTARGVSSLRDTSVEVSVHIGQRAGATIVLGLAGIPSSVDALAASTLRRALEIAHDTFRIAPAE